jgi:hypothetical protein
VRADVGLDAAAVLGAVAGEVIAADHGAGVVEQRGRAVDVDAAEDGVDEARRVDQDAGAAARDREVVVADGKAAEAGDRAGGLAVAPVVAGLEADDEPPELLLVAAEDAARPAVAAEAVEGEIGADVRAGETRHCEGVAAVGAGVEAAPIRRQRGEGRPGGRAVRAEVVDERHLGHAAQGVTVSGVPMPTSKDSGLRNLTAYP